MKKVNTNNILAICAAGAIFLPLVGSAQTAEALKVDDAGNVLVSGMLGVGTQNPVASFSVTETGTNPDRGLVVTQHSDNAAGVISGLRKSRGSEAEPTSVADGDYTGSFAFSNYSGTQWIGNAFFGARVNGLVTNSSVPTDLFFCTSDTFISNCYTQGKVRMVIDSDGNIGFGGQLTPAFPLHHANGAHLTAGGVWENSSSFSLKENIHGLTTAEAMEVVNDLNPVTFNYKLEKEEGRVGFIAEDVPGLVASNGRKSLSTMDILAVLTKVVQEQTKVIAELQEKVEMLEKHDSI